VALVASRKRGGTVKDMLREAGVPGVENVRNPAGIDLGARSAAEVALSIVAEIVQMSPATASGFCGGDRVAEPPDRKARTAPGGAESGYSSPAAAPVQSETAQPGPEGVAIDPICQMEVEIAGARYTAEFGGATYYFCCAGCRQTFLKDPAPFVATGP
jgi:xanthine dehydrogenase accessory factor